MITQLKQPPQFGQTGSRHLVTGPIFSTRRPSVVAMLDAAVAEIVNLAATDEFDVIAVQTLDEIPETVSRLRASAVLLSPNLTRDESRTALGRVLASLPSVTFIAVLGDDGASVHADLLRAFHNQVAVRQNLRDAGCNFGSNCFLAANCTVTSIFRITAYIKKW